MQSERHFALLLISITVLGSLGRSNAYDDAAERSVKLIRNIPNVFLYQFVDLTKHSVLDVSQSRSRPLSIYTTTD